MSAAPATSVGVPPLEADVPLPTPSAVAVCACRVRSLAVLRLPGPRLIAAVVPCALLERTSASVPSKAMMRTLVDNGDGCERHAASVPAMAESRGTLR